MFYDVAIIGAGVVGGLIGRSLSRYNLKICILEKNNDVAMGASMANSGIVHAGFDAKCGTLKAKLNVEGSKMMPKVTQDLGVKYINNGSMVIGFSNEDKRVINELYERGIKNGVEDLKIITGEEARKIEPNLKEEVICALYAKTGSIVCPYELTISAVGNAMDNGAILKTNFEVIDIKHKNDLYTISSANENVQASYVINAAGINSDEIAKMVGIDDFTINPRRGEYILLDKECGSLVKSTIFRTPTKMGKGILTSPTVDSNLLLGPTSEDIEDKDNKETTSVGLSKIIDGVNSNLNNIPASKVITSFTGLRAVGNTGDFIINIKNNFVNVAGIESPGLSSSPAIAEYVLNLLENSGLKLEEKENYIEKRKGYHYFKNLSDEEKNEIIKKDPRYGKIICRCEEVTLGEIIDAINQNPKATDIDGIKRRTRASMGRCQGSFCMPSLIEILANELNIPFEGVTKKGNNSYMNIGRTK